MWLWTILHLRPLHLPICMQLLKTRRIQLWQRDLGRAVKPINPGAIGVHDLA
jgi:hypothetical protein